MDRRMPPGSRQIAGATLAVSTMGGYSVTAADGEYVGYLHASSGDQWRAYRRRTNQMDDFLGRFGQVDAVLAILRASGRATGEVVA